MQRTLPRAVVLALLVGGTSAFVTQEHQLLPDPGDAPGHQRVDQDVSDDDVATPADTTPGAAAAADPTPGALPVEVPESAVFLVPVDGEDQAAPPAADPQSEPQSESRSRPRGRHAHRGRPADTGRSSTRWAEEGRHRPHSHRRDMDVPDFPATHHGTGTMNWNALARCEAGGNPHAVDPSGHYGGLYQFDSATWHSLGGHGRPQDASASEQTTRAARLYQRRGIAPWPTCGRRADG